MRKADKISGSSPLHLPSFHESAWEHVSGAASYVDDIRTLRDVLVGYVVAIGSGAGLWN